MRRCNHLVQLCEAALLIVVSLYVSATGMLQHVYHIRRSTTDFTVLPEEIRWPPLVLSRHAVYEKQTQRVHTKRKASQNETADSSQETPLCKANTRPFYGSPALPLSVFPFFFFTWAPMSRYFIVASV